MMRPRTPLISRHMPIHPFAWTTTKDDEESTWPRPSKRDVRPRPVALGVSNRKRSRSRRARSWPFKARRHRGDTSERDFVQSNLRCGSDRQEVTQAFRAYPCSTSISRGQPGPDSTRSRKFDWRKGFSSRLRHLVDFARPITARASPTRDAPIRLPVHAGDTLARVQRPSPRSGTESSADRRPCIGTLRRVRDARGQAD